MMHLLATGWRALIAAILIGGAITLAHAQTFPTKPIRFVVGFPPGGSADLLARLIGERIAATLGQPVVVENKVGAAGTIGADAVAKAPPDGYTLLLGPTSSQAIAPSVYPKLPYDPARDFRPITLVATIPVALVVHPGLRAQTPKDLISVAKAESLSFGSTGTGAMAHLTAELFQLEYGVRMVHVPYKGASTAISDFLAGRVQLMFDHLPTLLPYIRNGKLRVLGIAGNERAKALPEVPTLAEQGLSGLAVNSWFGVHTTAGVPDSIIAILHREIVKAMATDDAKTRLDAMGAEGRTNTPEEFSRMIAAEAALWARVVKATGVRSD